MQKWWVNSYGNPMIQKFAEPPFAAITRGNYSQYEFIHLSHVYGEVLAKFFFTTLIQFIYFWLQNGLQIVWTWPYNPSQIDEEDNTELFLR